MTAKQAPMTGNYMGATYTTEREHEAQTSALAARPGAMMLDYLRARLPDDEATWRSLSAWLGPMTSRGCGWRGWYSDSAIVLDGGVIAWCESAQRQKTWGVLVDLPGRACAALGDRLIPFLRWVLDAGGHVTRCDFAIDDRQGYLTLERILDADCNGGIVSRWRGLTVLQNRQRGKVIGWTVYIGSRSSEAMIRIYDKAGEQRRRGKDVPGHWVRLELECHQDFADALSRDYFARGSIAVVEQINRRLRFIVPSESDSNRWRAPAADWWEAFLGTVAPGESLLCGEMPECTVERLARYVERQAGPAMATVVTADGGDLGRVLDMLSRSVYRLKPKHKAALALAFAGGAT